MKQEQQPSLFIHNFKQISVFIIKLCAVMGVLFGLFCMISPQYLYSYNASLIDKIDRLEAINEPKIVLVGNSNLAFGINSEEIEDSFGMPVANLGLNSELGNPFLEEMSKLNVNEGDIYILCHTDYADDDTIGVPSVWVTIEDHFHLWKIKECLLHDSNFIIVPSKILPYTNITDDFIKKHTRKHYLKLFFVKIFAKIRKITDGRK